jgi:hypothetical protein
MSFFTRQTVTVLIDDENKVFIKKPGVGKRQEIISRASHATIKPDQSQEFTLDPGKLNTEQLCAYIVGWEGPGFDSKPPNRANILELDQDVADKVLLEINKLDQPTSDEEKKP